MISKPPPPLPTSHGISSHPTQNSPLRQPPVAAPPVDRSPHTCQDSICSCVNLIGPNAHESSTFRSAAERHSNAGGECKDLTHIGAQEPPTRTMQYITHDPLPDTAESQPPPDRKAPSSSSASLSSAYSESRAQSPFTSVNMSDDDDKVTSNDEYESGSEAGESPLTFATHELDDDEVESYWISHEQPSHSPLTFAIPDIDYEDEELGIVYRRGVSWPMAIPGAIPTINVAGDIAGEERRDGKSAPAALKRRSRSMSDMIGGQAATDCGGPVPTIERLSNSDWSTIEEQAQHRIGAGEGQAWDLGYILGGQGDPGSSRRSVDMVSCVQKPPPLQDNGYLLALKRKWGGVARPPSSIASSEDDPFTRNLEKWDPEYDARKDYWTIRREEDATSISSMTVVGSNTALTYPKGSIHESLGRISRGKGKGKEKHPVNQGMIPGTHELWKCGFVGMFNVERLMYSLNPSKAPHQRLHLRRIVDPVFNGNVTVHGGPSMIIHKHSRSVAFSIVRAYNFTGHERLGMGILLAPRRVQEHYTTTRHTSKLATHGLLEEDKQPDGGHGRRQSSSTHHSGKGKHKAVAETDSSNGKKSESKGGKWLGKGIVITDSSDLGPYSSELPLTALPESTDTSPPPASVTNQSAVANTPTDSFYEGVRPISDPTVRSLDAHGRPRHDSPDSYRKTLPHLTKPDISTPSFFRRFLRPPRTTPVGQTSLALGGDYNPPWMAMATRAKLEEVDKVMDRLHHTFMGVALATPNVRPHPKPKRRHSHESAIFEHLSDDTLYMLLPMWPAEPRSRTSATPRPNGAGTSYQIPALEDRCYLLVYYVPFINKSKRSGSGSGSGSGSKKRTSLTLLGEPTRSTNILLSEFRVCACVVGYAELRGSGVRLSCEGLVVSGHACDGVKFTPDPLRGFADPHGAVIGMYHGKERGVEFVPEGMLKLGLCQELPTRPRSQYSFDMVEETRLSTMGKAVVEMVWAGCMALSSFGTY